MDDIRFEDDYEGQIAFLIITDEVKKIEFKNPYPNFLLSKGNDYFVVMDKEFELQKNALTSCIRFSSFELALEELESLKRKEVDVLLNTEQIKEKMNNNESYGENSKEETDQAYDIHFVLDNGISLSFAPNIN